MNAAITHCEVLVTFDPLAKEKVSFSGPHVDAEARIRIPSGLGFVVFQLVEVNVPPGTAFFPSSPVQWIDEKRRPLLPPPVFTVHRLSDTNTTVQVINMTLDTREHPFFLIVQTAGGEFFGADPTVVTLRPGDSV